MVLIGQVSDLSWILHFNQCHTLTLQHIVPHRGDVDFGAARCWKLKNPDVINPITKEPIAFRLLPGPTPKLMAQVRVS